MATTLEPFYRQVILAFAKRTFNNRYSQKAIQDYDGIYKQFMRDIGGTRITEISDTTRKIISKTILDNRSEGVAVISKAINERMSPKFTRARASTIARTETHTASSFAIQKQAENFEAPQMRKKWIATTDDRSRASHLAVNGQEVGIDEDFVVGGKKMSYTGDPKGGASEVINCRCVIVYTEPEDVIVDQEIPREINIVPTESVDIKDVVFVEIRGSRTKARQQYNDLLNSQLSPLTRLAVLNNPLPDRIIKDGQNGFYKDWKNEITSGLNMKTLTHEYGHHIDYSLMKGKRVDGRGKLAWSEEQVFRDAVKKDIELSKLGKYDGIFFTYNVKYKDKLQKIKDELFQIVQKQKIVKSGLYKGLVKKYNGIEPKIDGAEYVSDIWDAFTAGKFQKEFNVWGHGTGYYKDGTSQMHEIFANLFTIHNSKQGLEYAKKNFPNSLKAFEDRLNEFK